MDISFVGGTDALEIYAREQSMSPEDYLIWLEEQLEAGDLTIHEVTEMIRDYNKRR